jgi:hypothetical protein
VEALWSVRGRLVICEKGRRIKDPFLIARSWRRREDSEEFEAIKVPFPLVGPLEGRQAHPDAGLVFHFGYDYIPLTNLSINRPMGISIF